jgi:hypothetical protein
MISEWRRRVCPFIRSHISSTNQKDLKLNSILEICSTTEFNFILCLCIPERDYAFGEVTRLRAGQLKDCVSIPGKDERIFSSSKHFAGSGFLFSRYWMFLPRGHSPRYSAEVKNNRRASPPLSWHAEGQICLYPKSQ